MESRIVAAKSIMSRLNIGMIIIYTEHPKLYWRGLDKITGAIVRVKHTDITFIFILVAR